jgi:hypothetical protein
MTETRNDGYERLMEDFAWRLQQAEARPVRGRGPRRVVVGALALAGTTAATAMLVGGGGGGLDVVAQAKAALAPAGQIVHLVTTAHLEMRGGSQTEIVGREAEENAPRVIERWSASKPLRWRVASVVPIVTARRTSTGPVQLSYSDGTEELYIQSLNTLSIRTGVSEESPRLSSSDGPLGVDPVTRIHSMLEAGQLHDAGSGTVNGHAVKRLVGKELNSPIGVSRAPWPVEYDVDPETYAPVRFTVEEVGMSFPGNTGIPTLVVDVTAYEQLPFNQATAPLLRIHPTGSPTVERHRAGG